MGVAIDQVSKAPRSKPGRTPFYSRHQLFSNQLCYQTRREAVRGSRSLQSRKAEPRNIRTRDMGYTFQNFL
jgi:hypothetical protein